MTPPIQIDICICTFRRPHLTTTLQSLAKIQVPDGVRIRILVADNDTAPSAAPLIEPMHGKPFPIQYIHAPDRNISVARNACLDHSTGDLVAWIDDDETVDAAWLVQLYTNLIAHKYTAVFGPAIAVYPTDTPAHIARGDFHSNRPVTRAGEVRTGHTCNALVDMRAPTTRALRFDLSKGRTGGEDTDYFHRLWQTGVTFGICDTAQVFEDVAPARLRPGWLIRRSFNSGHIFGELARRGAATPSVLRLMLTALAKAGYCFACACLTVAFATKRLWWARRGVMHLGVMAGLFRITPKAQY